MAGKGSGDVCFVVRGERIVGVKSILEYSNSTIKDLIGPDGTESNPIILDTVISPEGFRNLLKYYGYVSPQLNKNTIVDTLVTTIYFNEPILFDTCLQYLLDNIDNDLIQQILRIKHKIVDNELKITLLKELDRILNKNRNISLEDSVNCIYYIVYLFILFIYLSIFISSMFIYINLLLYLFIFNV